MPKVAEEVKKDLEKGVKRAAEVRGINKYLLAIRDE